MKKIFLTSAICMCMALPSYADIASGASSATCDTTTIGATEGSTGLEAQWSANQYSENPGYYLLYANNTVSTNQTCTAGNYCPGFTNQTFNDQTMGLNSCATNDANFPNSAAGASAATDCYRACNINNMGTESGKTIAPIAHATVISGNDYYGAGVDTCVPTACESGYHVGGGAGPLADYVATDASSYSNYPLDNGKETAGNWYITWSDGTIVNGSSACTTTSGTTYGSNGTKLPYSSFTSGTTGGVNCWCRIDSYSITGGATQSVVSTYWVAKRELSPAGNCAASCAVNCAIDAKQDRSIRSAFFGELGENTPITCQANTINITWYKQNGEANVENQCTYGGAVTIPEQPTKAGYTFGGWRIKSN